MLQRAKEDIIIESSRITSYTSRLEYMGLERV